MTRIPLVGNDRFAVGVVAELALVLLEGAHTKFGLCALGDFMNPGKELLVCSLAAFRMMAAHLGQNLNVLSDGSAAFPGTAVLEGRALGSNALHLLGEDRVGTGPSLEGGAFGLQFRVAHGEWGLQNEGR